MNCRQSRRLLALHRELGARERAAVAAHVASCDDCAAAWRAYQAQDRALAALPRLAPPAHLPRTFAAARPRAAVARRSYALALAVALLLAGLGITARVSASALPGEPLYGVKRAVESVRQALATGDAARQALDRTLAERRRFEARELQRLGRTAEVEFDGIVENAADGEWTMAGVRIQVPAAVLTGPAPLGQTVWVRARVTAGRFVALQVSPREEAPAPAEPSAPPPGRAPAQGVGPQPGAAGQTQQGTPPGPRPTHTPQAQPLPQQPAAGPTVAPRSGDGPEPMSTATPASQGEQQGGPAGGPTAAATPRLPGGSGPGARNGSQR
ncbi:MAG: DUF5667 domain-containing protein [Anaerolineae bacterium]|jgi:hypothetical protein